jgi:hypothetical protein
VLTTTRRRLSVAAACMAVGAAAVAPTFAQAAPVTLDGVRTSLTTDAATTKVLIQNKILPLPVGPTSARIVSHRWHDGMSGMRWHHRMGGLQVRYGFPITGGQVDSETLAGSINHSGGLVFVNLNNGKTLTLTDFTINIDKDPDLTAAVGGDPNNTRVSILNLDLSKAEITKPLPFVKVKGVTATLTEGAAAALNQTLGTTIFAKGLTLGTANVKARVAS